MTDLITKENINIENKIYNIRGKQVMLSSDVAKEYHVETKRLNEVIKRNKNRFPEEFCFQLTRNEYTNLRSQFATSSLSDNYGGIRYYPYVLTEQGVMMLSGLLKSNIAVEVNIKIINAFVKMRKYISSTITTDSNILVNHENRILKIEETIDKLSSNIKLTGIYYKGQIYEAYSALVDILKTSNKKIIIIDNYVDKTILDILTKIDNKIKIIIICDKETTYLKDIDVNKYNEEFNNLKVVYNNSFHDRFFIIDNKKVYHCGSSINRIGYKTFAINKLDDDVLSSSFINHVKDIIKS